MFYIIIGTILLSCGIVEEFSNYETKLSKQIRDSCTHQIVIQEDGVTQYTIKSNLEWINFKSKGMSAYE